MIYRWFKDLQARKRKQEDWEVETMRGNKLGNRTVEAMKDNLGNRTVEVKRDNELGNRTDEAMRDNNLGDRTV